MSDSDSLIIKAAQFAAKCHKGQVRKYTGAAYETHLQRVAGRVAMHPKATPVMVKAAFNHDNPEDCGTTFEQLATVIGDEATELVRQLTNPTKGMKAPRAERKRLDREHIANISEEAKIIKLIDRIDNLNELPAFGEGEESFIIMYCKESQLLLEVLRGVDAELENELEGIIKWKMRQYDDFMSANPGYRSERP